MKQIQTGLEARWLEQLEGLHKEILYFEKIRLASDDLDPLKTIELYELYWKLYFELLEKGLI